ncbi:MAG TPA: hypothetical protein VJ204_11090 [Solirubrobacterales bacterium]|nr:hypothetical protein [Solirubrobacterales bacterium]
MAFVVAFLAFLVTALLQGQKPFYYDSGAYWALSETFVKAGHFSFLNFENTDLRGYGLPFIYFLLRNAGEFLGLADATTVAIFNAAVFAVVGAVLAPRLSRVAMPNVGWGLGRRLLLCAVLWIFWRGFLNYPMSDFVALALALVALCAVGSSISTPAFALAGASAALALDVRPAYFLLVPIVVILYVWRWYAGDERRDRRWILRFACLAAAVVVVSLPQSLSQHDRYGSWTPLPGGSGLVGLQYTDGLLLQRYDTYVGGSETQVQMNYLDNDTKGILEGLESGQVKSTGQYARIVVEHPVTLAGVFLRHLVNGLDQRYDTPYVEHLEGAANKPFRVAGFLLVFLALVRIAWPRSRRRLGPISWRYLVALLLCSVSSIASAVETRFLLPVFLLAAIFVLLPGWPSPVYPVGSGRSRYLPLAAIVIAAVVFFGVVAIVVSGASNSLVLGPG